MGQRGPKPKAAGKTLVFSTRIRPELRAKLGEAAAESGRSLSEEVSHRLTRSFLFDEKVADNFGSRRNFVVMKLISDLIETTYNPTSPEHSDWLDDPYVFDQAASMVALVLGQIRPPEDPSKPRPEKDFAASMQEHFRHSVVRTFRRLKLADPALPLTEGSNRDHREAMFKAEAGDLVDRAWSPVVENSADAGAKPTKRPPRPAPAKGKRT